MRFMTKYKKKLALTLAILSVFTLAVGTLAFFTDRITSNSNFQTADSSDIIKIAITDPNDPDPTNPSTDPTKDMENLWKARNEALISEGLLRPGDAYQLGYQLTNLGEDIIIRETFIITITDGTGKAMTMSAAPEWRMFTAFDTDKYGAKTGSAVLATEKQLAGNQYKYEIAPFVLKAGANKDLSYYTILDKYAGNNFQNSKCTVEYLVEMCQYSEGAMDGLENYAGWETICSSTITFGGNSNYPAVPQS